MKYIQRQMKCGGSMLLNRVHMTWTRLPKQILLCRIKICIEQDKQVKDKILLIYSQQYHNFIIKIAMQSHNYLNTTYVSKAGNASISGKIVAQKCHDHKRIQQNQNFSHVRSYSYLPSSIDTQSTKSKLKKLLQLMKQCDLLSFFQRFIQQFNGQFRQQIRLHYDEDQTNQGICIGSLALGDNLVYGPVFGHGKNASEAIISAIKALVFEHIIQDQECDKQKIIKCLKNRKQKSHTQIKYPNADNNFQRTKQISLASGLASQTTQQLLFKNQLDKINEKMKKIEQKIQQQNKLNLKLKNLLKIKNEKSSINQIVLVEQKDNSNIIISGQQSSKLRQKQERKSRLATIY